MSDCIRVDDTRLPRFHVCHATLPCRHCACPPRVRRAHCDSLAMRDGGRSQRFLGFANDDASGDDIAPRATAALASLRVVLSGALCCSHSAGDDDPRRDSRLCRQRTRGARFGPLPKHQVCDSIKSPVSRVRDSETCPSEKKRLLVGCGASPSRFRRASRTSICSCSTFFMSVVVGESALSSSPSSSSSVLNSRYRVSGMQRYAQLTLDQTPWWWGDGRPGSAS